jgi:hypothetical protein
MKGTLSNDLLKLRSKLETIEKQFEEKLVSVKSTEEKHKKVENQLEQFIVTKDNIITLNIGGKKFLTKTSTLLSKKDSLFNQMINSYINNNEEIPSEFFFDRSYTHFKTILDYLRTGQLNLKKFKNYDRLDIEEELEYYGLVEKGRNKKLEYEIGWSTENLKGCSVSPNDEKLLNVHSNTCYTHFLTNRKFIDEDFIIEFESSVLQTDNYFYFGIINENYSLTGNCFCCSPVNSFYIQCNGTVHINSQNSTVSELAWNSETVVIGMKIVLSERLIYFYIKDKFESGPYQINSGTQFTVVSGHCNNGNGTIKILDCFQFNKNDLN